MKNSHPSIYMASPKANDMGKGWMSQGDMSLFPDSWFQTGENHNVEEIFKVLSDVELPTRGMDSIMEEGRQKRKVDSQSHGNAEECVQHKRIRCAQVHNKSERMRRDRIKAKIRALQELIPNCNKSDRASILDDAIEYLRALKLQLHMMFMGLGGCQVPYISPTSVQLPNSNFSPLVQMRPALGLGFGIGPGFPMMLHPSPSPSASSAMSSSGDPQLSFFTSPIINPALCHPKQGDFQQVPVISQTCISPTLPLPPPSVTSNNTQRADPR